MTIDAINDLKAGFYGIAIFLPIFTDRHYRKNNITPHEHSIPQHQ